MGRSGHRSPLPAPRSALGPGKRFCSRWSRKAGPSRSPSAGGESRRMAGWQRGRGNGRIAEAEEPAGPGLRGTVAVAGCNGPAAMCCNWCYLLYENPWMRRKEESERKEGCEPNIHSLGVVRRSFWKRACVGVDNLGIASRVGPPHKAEGYRGPPRAQPVTLAKI